LDLASEVRTVLGIVLENPLVSKVEQEGVEVGEMVKVYFYSKDMEAYLMLVVNHSPTMGLYVDTGANEDSFSFNDNSVSKLIKGIISHGTDDSYGKNTRISVH